MTDEVMQHATAHAAADRKPTIAEHLASASNSSDLTVSLEKRGDADYLIASGKSPATLGRFVYQLMSEWDACAKPRPFTDDDVQRLAKGMSADDVARWEDKLPAVKLDRRRKPKAASLEVRQIAAARLELEQWLTMERRRVLGRLGSLSKLMDPHSGLLPWVIQQGFTNPREKLLDVLGWWADRRCTSCNGTGVRNEMACSCCKGLRERDIPHRADGQAISERIAKLVDESRRGTVAMLKHMRELKEVAAGKK